MITRETDYIEDYNEFWKDLVEKDGVLDKDAVMRELHDFHFMMEEVPKVYMEVSGGRISKTNTYAFEVISQFNELHWDKEMIQEDVKAILETKESSAEEKLKEIEEYLEINLNK